MFDPFRVQVPSGEYPMKGEVNRYGPGTESGFSTGDLIRSGL
jgi:hypothetical protein